MLGWTQGKLAEEARVSRMTVVFFEVERQMPHVNNLAAIRSAFEAAGIEFIDENGGGPGIRIRLSGSAAHEAGLRFRPPRSWARSRGRRGSSQPE